MTLNTDLPKRVRIKMCGMTNLEDVLFAANIGVDAIGLIFYPMSPRAIDIHIAKEITQHLPPFITKVALFVNPTKDQVNDVLQHIRIDLLQFHGTELLDFCESFAIPYIKAIHFDDQQVSNLNWEQIYPSACGFLIDTYHRESFGGTGQAFNWKKLPKNLTKPLILAGGLTAANVKSAIEIVQPYAVDVTSGVESTKGFKDHQKMVDFVKQVNSL